MVQLWKPFLLALAVLGAGCAGAGQGTSSLPSSSAPPPAPPPTAGPMTGSLAGVVVTDEMQPIVGARVAVLEANVQVVSDEGGNFTVNDLEPGSYRVIVEALGFESFGRKVDIAPGQITELRAVLTAIPISEEAVLVPVQRNVFFNVDSGWVGFTTVEQAYANLSALHNLRCSPCFSIFHFRPAPKGLQSELQFEGTYVSPAGAPFVIMKYTRNWTDGSTGTAHDSNTGVTLFRPVINHKAHALWPEANAKEVAKAHDKMKVHYFVSGGGLVVNLRVESWTVFAYGGPIPEDYRVIPPA